MFEATQDLIERQLENERRQVHGGKNDYRKGIEKDRTKRQYGLTKPGTWIIETCLPALVQNISARIGEALQGKAGRHNFVVNYLQWLDPKVTAYLTLRILMDFTMKEDSRKTTVAKRIGLAVREELVHLTMRSQNKKAYDYWNQRAREATHATTRQRCIEKLKAISDLSAFDNIKDEDIIYIGLACIEDAKNACGMVCEVRVQKGKKTQDFLELSPYFVEQAEQFNRHCEDRWPWHDPMIVPPKPWDGALGGGYIGELANRTKIIRTPNRLYLEEIHLNRDKFGPVFKALNAIQATPWRINKRVFEVMDQAWAADIPSCFGLPNKKETPLPPMPETCKTDARLRQQHAFKIQEIRDENRTNKGHRLALSKILGTAWLFRDEEAIYFPHNLDWRGRIYPMARYLSPQGSEISQALLQFAEGKALETEVAAGWLAVHGANCFGEDKVSFEERIAWVQRHEEQIRASAANPLDYLWWAKEADNPWMFLAWCFEWVGFLENGLNHVSHISIAMDGSCNGLQNFTAMLRDPETARAVNLLPSDKPNDIYQQVADIVSRRVEELAGSLSLDDATLTELAESRTNDEINKGKEMQKLREAYEKLREKVKADKKEQEKLKIRGKRPQKIVSALKSDEYRKYKELEAGLNEAKTLTGLYWTVLGARWLRGQISRNLVKQPVMTYPYAVSEYGVKKQIAKKLQELCRAGKINVPYNHCSKIAYMLKGIVFQTVREEVRAAAQAMDWLKHVAEIVSKHNKPISWFSPIGLLVVQEYRKAESKRVDTQIGGARVRQHIEVHNSQIDPNNQANAIAPNFVHSCDASHLMRTVSSCLEYGVTAFHMIHDSYGTHAANAGLLAKALREQFVEQYSGNVLQKFLDELSVFLPSEAVAEIQPPPKQGDFDLNLVLKSRYFFV